VNGVRAGGLRDRVHEGGLLPEVARALDRGHDAGERAVRLEAAVVEVERVADRPRGEIGRHVERTAAHERMGISLRVLAGGDRHVAEMLAPGPVLVHVAVRPHADHVDGADEPPRGVERLVVPHQDPLLRPGPRRLRAPVPGPVADDGRREPARDRGGGVHDGRARGAPAIRDLAPPAEPFDAQPARDRDLVCRLHLEHAHAVHVLGPEAGVVERELDRLDGGVGDGAADVLGERQVADADDRDPVLEAAEEVAVEGVGHA